MNDGVWYLIPHDELVKIIARKDELRGWNPHLGRESSTTIIRGTPLKLSLKQSPVTSCYISTELGAELACIANTDATANHNGYAEQSHAFLGLYCLRAELLHDDLRHVATLFRSSQVFVV